MSFNFSSQIFLTMAIFSILSQSSVIINSSYYSLTCSRHPSHGQNQTGPRCPTGRVSRTAPGIWNLWALRNSSWLPFSALYHKHSNCCSLRTLRFYLQDLYPPCPMESLNIKLQENHLASTGKQYVVQDGMQPGSSYVVEIQSTQLDKPNLWSWGNL